MHRLHHAIAIAVFVCATGLSPGGAATAQPADPFAAMRAALRGLPLAQLQAQVMDCSREAEQRLLGFDDAAHCSTAWELLKERGFGGDFGAMLAWWRQARERERSRVDISRSH